MKTLFNEYEAYTKEGGELSDEVYKITKCLLKKYEDYPTYEIEKIFIDSITVCGACERARRCIERRKKGE